MVNTWYVATDGSGSNTASGNSFATRWKDLSAVTAANGVLTGDTVKIMQTPSATSLGQTAQWTDGSNVVTLTTAVTGTVSLCDTAFTAATNVTCATDTDRRQGTNSASFVIGAPFTTGLVGYQAITSANFSAYTQLTFMIKVSADVPANTLKLALCSDTAGVTIVNSVTVAEIIKAGMWTPIAIDTGATLGTAIQSVALYALTNPGTITIKLDNILVAKAPASADSVTLVSLIGKNTATETWYGIESINGTTITLARDPQNGAPASMNGYSGTTESVTTYKKETYKTALLASGSGANAATVNVSGITLSGGWDTTAMSSQAGDTWYDGRNGGGEGLYIGGANGNSTTVNGVAFIRYNDGVQINGSTSVTLTTAAANNNVNNGIFVTGVVTGLNITPNFTCANGSIGCNVAGSSVGAIIVNAITSLSNGSHGIQTATTGIDLLNTTAAIVASRNTGNGFDLGTCNSISTLTARYNTQNGINYKSAVQLLITTYTSTSNTNSALQLNAIPNIKIENFTCTGDAVDVNSQNGFFELVICNAAITSGVYAKNFWNGPGNRNTHDWVRFHRVNSSPLDNRIYSQAGTMVTQTATMYTGAIKTWKMSPTATWLSSSNPMPLSVRKAAVWPSGAVTFTVSLYQTSSNINAQIRIKGARVGGVPADVVTAASGTPGQWNNFSVSATPNEAGGVLECVVEAWGGTTDSVYVGQVQATQ